MVRGSPCSQERSRIDLAALRLSSGRPRLAHSHARRFVRIRGDVTMSRSTNAVLLSALVLPGAGHLYLKQYPRGIALIVISLACLWIFVDRAMQQASIVLERLASEGGVVDAGQISDLVAQASNSSGSLAVTVATLVLAVCWVVGIVDAYRLGKNKRFRNGDNRR